MTTTTGDPSSLKSPPSLSSGDLVTRFLAATPPYLYNVPLTPHSFFFSEMLRSFVQAKAEASPVPTGSTPSRRRKRSWREVRERPLELTTKERPHHQRDEYQLQPRQDGHENRKRECLPEVEAKVHAESFEQKPALDVDVLKPVDENRAEFIRHSRSYFDDRQSHFRLDQAVQETGIYQGDPRKLKPEEPPPGERKSSCTERPEFEERARANSDLGFLPDQKQGKLDFASRNFLGARGDEIPPGSLKNFGLPANVPNPEFLPNPLWYPPYHMSQSYSGIDPMHFFIDLHVSGHIWDRKLNERQLPFKSKHSSAFSVPQSKEYNRPLNLTRDEATTSRGGEENSKGTHYILKNLTRTYKDIRDAEKLTRTDRDGEQDEEDRRSDSEANESLEKEGVSSSSQADEKRDLRALIDLELVVDYVKEPKSDHLSSKQTPQITE
ncbi:uncharacterized protein LOC105697188 [Orussus abietinus]|uniref:uncharacterized protein LOC105697188 n=1 Tax=Orussus abietinus TaxID=222816 RepID=UPI000625F7D7|nr:uncharacterized protein LOC105697188 [Orussus abietinus]